MGGEVFKTVAVGKTAKEAFEAAVEEAQYEYGHGGYSGTIAEKRRFAMVECPKGVDPHEYAEKLIDQDDPRISDKWGAAGCIALGDDKWLFFGWASS